MVNVMGHANVVSPTSIVGSLFSSTDKVHLWYRSCETCGKTLFSHSGFMKHRRLHAGAYKYFCGICRRGFFDQTNLRAHADSRHSKVRRYACSLCNKSFYWKHHVKRHLKACGRGAKAVAADDNDADTETGGNNDEIHD